MTLSMKEYFPTLNNKYSQQRELEILFGIGILSVTVLLYIQTWQPFLVLKFITSMDLCATGFQPCTMMIVNAFKPYWISFLKIKKGALIKFFGFLPVVVIIIGFLFVHVRLCKKMEKSLVSLEPLSILLTIKNPKNAYCMMQSTTA